MLSLFCQCTNRSTTCILGMWMCVLALWSGAVAFAQEAEPQRLIDQDPYDVVIVSDAEGDHELKVFPLKLTPREMPKKPVPTEMVRMRLLEDVENRDFEAQWKDIKLIKFFEDMVLAETEALVAEQKFDEAYEYYQYLLKNYPKHPQLENSIHTYWYLSAGAAFRAKRNDEALAILEALLQANPAYKQSDTSPSLLRILSEIVDKLVQRYYDKKDYRSARQLLSRILKTYPASKSEKFATKWKAQLSDEAAKHRTSAEKSLAEKRYTEAYDSSLKMLEIWPDVEGGKALAKKIGESYPVMLVGVSVKGNHPNIFRFDHWGDRRTGRLTDRRLTEQVAMSAEGGVYESPLGSILRSEDGRVLQFQLKPAAATRLSATEVSRLLLSGTRQEDANFSPAWAEIFGDVRIVNPNLVEVMLRRSHVIPRALPAFPLTSVSLSAEEAALRTGAYLMNEEGDKLRFVLPVGEIANVGQIREIQEHYFTDPQKALLEFERGKIDCLDRISPVDLERVRALPGVIVGKYSVPVIHALVPNMSRPWPRLRVLRRAILYGTRRNLILEQGILNGRAMPGAQLMSGPFPAAFDANDTLSYANDSTIVPYAFEPLLAMTLFELAQREAKSQANLRKEPEPKFESLMIGHPPAELPKLACRAMAKQLETIGIPCKLVEVDGQLPMPPDVDFLYAELSIGEPVVDAIRLFGSRGLYPSQDPHLRLAVRRVEQASTWNEASQRLRDLHRLIHEELTVLPLYQTPEFYAVRKNVTGLTTSPNTFYQNIEQWRISPRLLED